MLKYLSTFALTATLVSLAASPAAAQKDNRNNDHNKGHHRGPLLVEVEAGTPIVFLDPSDPSTATFDLHLLVENISKDRTVRITDIRGELEFDDDLTSPFILYDGSNPDEQPLILAPGSASLFFAVLIVPLDAPTGEATAVVEVTYLVGGRKRTVEVEVDFAVIRVR
jgi:hypothetical protein